MSIKIMTYNVDFRSKKDKDLVPRLYSFIAGVNFEKPDILCLQEFGGVALAVVNVFGGMGYECYPGDRDVCTFVKKDIRVDFAENVKFMYNTSGCLTYSKAGSIGKGFTFFRMSKPEFKSGMPFNLANTHLEPHDKNAAKRTKQFYTMVQYLEREGSNISIIAGDLNDPNASRFANTHGYEHDNEQLVTHHHVDNVRRKQKRAAARKDWVLVRGAKIRAGSVRTIRFNYRNGGSETRDISDHSAVITELE